MRFIAGFIICLGCLVTSGCQILRHAIIHPHSEVMTPTFCLYRGSSNPSPIQQITVYTRGPGNPVWIVEYAPGPPQQPFRRSCCITVPKHILIQPEYTFSQKTVRPFCCITYGKVPPGYREKIMALPLIPETPYVAIIEDLDTGVRGDVYFVIRSDSIGRPVRLEHR